MLATRIGTMRGNWVLLFEKIDEDNSGRLSFDEFAAAAEFLGVDEALDEDSLRALWAYIDNDNSGEVTIK